MRFLLCGINAKYIHSNLAIFSLKTYAEEVAHCPGEIIIKEYTINHYVDQILKDLYLEKADVIIFSCYIWNIHYVKELAAELKKVAPSLKIWVGGPEVSYHADQFLLENPAVDLVMQGEGEAAFASLVKIEESLNHTEIDIDMETGLASRREALLRALPGIAFRVSDSAYTTDTTDATDTIDESDITDVSDSSRTSCPADCSQGNANTGFAPLTDLDEIPFVYKDFELFQNKILYYETSRGCPFRCSYCLSSVDKTVRLRSLELVFVELQQFLDARVPQVKFVDRTFNCNKKHARAIWQYIVDHDNGVTNFHFEISSDLLEEEDFALFAQMRPGLIQLEIGVQSTNPPTIDAIHRYMDLPLLWANVDRVHALGNIHQHLDLIIGLPYEDYHQFQTSFNEMFVHAPDQLQVGFLKVLKGTVMEEEAEQYGIVYRENTPYEVLQTKWLSFDDVIRLKGIEELVELYYNSFQFTYTLRYIIPKYETPFGFFETFARYYQEKGLHKLNHNRMQKYEILRDFVLDSLGEGDCPYLDQMLLFDMYLRENGKSRPKWARDLNVDKKALKEMYRLRSEELFPDAAIDSKQAANMSHVEVFTFDVLAFVASGSIEEKAEGWETKVLFDYTCRNPLNKEARTLCIDEYL